MAKYSKKAGEKVERAMKEMKKGKLRSGRSGKKVTSRKQAIAIGLSEARRAGVKLKPPKKGKASEKTRRSAEQAYKKGQRHEPVSKTRSRAREKALKREPTSSASHTALSRQAHEAAMERTSSER